MLGEGLSTAEAMSVTRLARKEIVRVIVALQRKDRTTLFVKRTRIRFR